MHESVRAPKLLCKLIAFRFRMRCVYSSVVFFFIRPFFFGCFFYFRLIHYETYAASHVCDFHLAIPMFRYFGDTICVRTNENKTNKQINE